MAKKKADTTETSAGPLVAFKGFDTDFKCRDMQYEVGKTYKADGRPVRCGSTGFHACDNPFDVWRYYPPVSDSGALNRFAEVSFVGEIDRTDADDTKFAGVEIAINAELKLPEFIMRGVEYILSKVDFEGVSTNTGDWSVSTNTGNRSAATNTGYRSAATNTGYRSAATNTGDQSAATNTGNWSVSTVEGKDSVAMASGYEGRVSGADGCALFLVERNNDYEIVAAWAGIVGKGGIKPGVFYTLRDGQPVEVA